MKKVMTALLLCTTLWMSAQDRYTQGMEKAFSLWGEGKNVEASNLFERISTAEPDKWEPPYYVAMVNTFSSFGMADKDKMKAQLDKAQEFIDIAKNISADNPEILVMQAMVHTAWIASDGMLYGPVLSGKVTGLYAKAQQLAPDNPRVVLAKAEWDMGAAKFFGQDTTPFCKDIERSLELFATFKQPSPFYPTWGKERAEEVATTCKKG